MAADSSSSSLMPPLLLLLGQLLLLLLLLLPLLLPTADADAEAAAPRLVAPSSVMVTYCQPLKRSYISQFTPLSLSSFCPVSSDQISASSARRRNVARSLIEVCLRA